MLVVVVDDILHVASSHQLIDDFAASMSDTYAFKNLGEPTLMVGMRVTISPRAIRLDQAQYIKQLAASFEQLDAAPVHCPASVHGCLGSADSHGSQQLDTYRCPYLSLVGGLLWVTLTRPDIAVAVSRACQHSKAPTTAHWRAAIRILRFLLTTADRSITFQRRLRPVSLDAFADAAFANESGKRSRYGHAIYLSDCLVCWLTKPTTAVCLSTAEAEFIAAAEAAKDIIWLRNFLHELGFSQSLPTVLHEDNQACVAMVRNHVVTARNRHFAVKMAWLRQQVATGSIKLQFVASKKNLADLFTKILPAEAFRILSDMLLRRGMSPRGGC